MADPKGAGASSRLKMKDLERATGVGRESIRFYIHEGLLPEPQRPARNVAYYDRSFVDRVRLIKELQQKRYLPLQVIKAIVTADEAPSAREAEALLQLDGRLGSTTAGARERLTALATRLGIPAREIRELATVEALAISRREGEEWLEPTGVRLVELWARMREAGFTPERGFGPEKIRLYVDMVRLLAREELREFSRGIAGRVDTDKAVRMAEDGIELGSQVIALLRRETLLRFIAEANRGERAARPPRTGAQRARSRPR